MAIRPFVTAWAHVRVMLKRRLLAQVMLDEIELIERVLPGPAPQGLDRGTLKAPRPRFVVLYPAHYVTFFDADVARLVRDYLDALEDYLRELRTPHDTAGQPGSADPLWPRVRDLRRAGGTLRATLQELAGKRANAAFPLPE